MFEITYLGFCFILIMMMVIGAFAALFFKAKFEAKEETKKVTICYDYKTSKDYDRLYELLNGRQTVLVRSCTTHNIFYNAFKSHRKEEYYLGSYTEYLPDKEKFIYYCKFKEIEFLDFIN